MTETRAGRVGIKAKDHYQVLPLVHDDLFALELVDGDAHEGIQSTPITGQGFQRLRWRRYEIESYLVHPAALARFCTDPSRHRGWSAPGRPAASLRGLP